MIFTLFFSLLTLTSASAVPHFQRDGGNGLLRLTVSATVSNTSTIVRKHLTVSPLENVQTGTRYLVDFSIGSPPQPIAVALDTGSSETWVNPQCSTSGGKASIALCNTIPVYDPSKSSTAQDQSVTNTLGYGKGSADIEYYTDNFAIGAATIHGQIFGVAQSGVDIPTGLMGVGPGIELTGYPCVVDSLATQGVTQSRAFSLDLRGVDSPDGAIIFGGIDTMKYIGNLEKCPIIPAELAPDGFNRYWIYMISVGITKPGSTVSKLYDPTSSDPQGQPVFLDSGGTLSRLPTSLFNAIIADFPGATQDGDSGLYLVDCALASQDGTVDFGFGNTVIHVPYNEFIWHIGTLCYVGIAANDDTPVLGDSFLRAAFVVYDQDNQNLLLANAANCGTNLVAIGKGVDAVPSIVGGCGISATSSSLPSSTVESSSLPTSFPSSSVEVVSSSIGMSNVASSTSLALDTTSSSLAKSTESPSSSQASESTSTINFSSLETDVVSITSSSSESLTPSIATASSTSLSSSSENFVSSTSYSEGLSTSTYLFSESLSTPTVVATTSAISSSSSEIETSASSVENSSLSTTISSSDSALSTSSTGTSASSSESSSTSATEGIASTSTAETLTLSGLPSSTAGEIISSLLESTSSFSGIGPATSTDESASLSMSFTILATGLASSTYLPSLSGPYTNSTLTTYDPTSSSGPPASSTTGISSTVLENSTSLTAIEISTSVASGFPSLTTIFDISSTVSAPYSNFTASDTSDSIVPTTVIGTYVSSSTSILVEKTTSLYISSSSTSEIPHPSTTGDTSSSAPFPIPSNVTSTITIPPFSGISTAIPSSETSDASSFQASASSSLSLKDGAGTSAPYPFTNATSFAISKPTSATGSVGPTGLSTKGGQATSTSDSGDVISTYFSEIVYTITSCSPTVTDCPAKVGMVTTETIPITTTVSGTVATTTAYTTSTIFATSVYTITSCAPTVTDCPSKIGQVTTEIISLYTTVCPVSTPAPLPLTSSSVPSLDATTQYTTSTVYATSIYTVTSCAPTVTDCPSKIGQITTEIISLYTTVCPITSSPTPTASPLLSTSVSTIFETKVYTVSGCASSITDCPGLGKIATETLTSYSTVTLLVSPVYSTGISTLYETKTYTLTANPIESGKVITETLTSYTTITRTLYGNIISTAVPETIYSTAVSTLYSTKVHTLDGSFLTETLTSYSTKSVTIYPKTTTLSSTIYLTKTLTVTISNKQVLTTSVFPVVTTRTYTVTGKPITKIVSISLVTKSFSSPSSAIDPPIKLVSLSAEQSGSIKSVPFAETRTMDSNTATFKSAAPTSVVSSFASIPPASAVADKGDPADASGVPELKSSLTGSIAKTAPPVPVAKATGSSTPIAFTGQGSRLKTFSSGLGAFIMGVWMLF